MKYFSAWATITGRVFIDEVDLQTALSELGCDTPIDLCEPVILKQAYKLAARQKLAELMPTDMPMKVNETTFDLSTLSL